MSTGVTFSRSVVSRGDQPAPVFTYLRQSRMDRRSSGATKLEFAAVGILQSGSDARVESGLLPRQAGVLNQGLGVLLRFRDHPFHGVQTLEHEVV